MTDSNGGQSEYERLLSQIGWDSKGQEAVPPPAAAPAEPALPAWPASVEPAQPADALAAEPVSEEWDEDDIELTEAEATIAPNSDEVADPAPAVPEEPSPVHPHVQVASAAPLPEAGWYPDPHNPANYRWWDGTAWTDAVHSVLRNDTRYQPGSSTQARKDVRGAIRGLADDLGKQ